MEVTEMVMNKEYNYNMLEEEFEEAFEFEEHGVDLIGESFLVLREINANDHIMSFVMTGYTSNGSVFKLIYSDYL